MNIRKKKSEVDNSKKVERSEEDNRKLLFQVNRFKKIFDDFKPRMHNKNGERKPLTQLFPYSPHFKDKERKKRNQLTRINDYIEYIKKLNLDLTIFYSPQDRTLEDDDAFVTLSDTLYSKDLVTVTKDLTTHVHYQNLPLSSGLIITEKQLKNIALKERNEYEQSEVKKKSQVFTEFCIAGLKENKRLSGVLGCKSTKGHRLDSITSTQAYVEYIRKTHLGISLINDKKEIENIDDEKVFYYYSHMLYDKYTANPLVKWLRNGWVVQYKEGEIETIYKKINGKIKTETYKPTINNELSNSNLNNNNHNQTNTINIIKKDEIVKTKIIMTENPSSSLYKSENDCSEKKTIHNKKKRKNTIEYNEEQKKMKFDKVIHSSKTNNEDTIKNTQSSSDFFPFPDPNSFDNSKKVMNTVTEIIDKDKLIDDINNSSSHNSHVFLHPDDIYKKKKVDDTIITDLSIVNNQINTNRVQENSIILDNSGEIMIIQGKVREENEKKVDSTSIGFSTQFGLFSNSTSPKDKLTLKRLKNVNIAVPEVDEDFYINYHDIPQKTYEEINPEYFPFTEISQNEDFFKNFGNDLLKDEIFNLEDDIVTFRRR